MATVARVHVYVPELDCSSLFMSGTAHQTRRYDRGGDELPICTFPLSRRTLVHCPRKSAIEAELHHMA